jgi:transcriptional regulator with XRE-family HTH domain
MPRKRASDDPSVPIIARNLRVIRADLKLPQGDVATKAAVPQAQLSRWEKGRQKPEVDALLRVAAVYKCSVDDLLAGIYRPYDEIIAEGMAPDVRRHFEARLAVVEHAAIASFTATVRGVRNVPMTATLSEVAKASRGRSTRARARRKPPK